MVVQLLHYREAVDSGEVCLYRHLRHGQGNPSATTDATLDGIEDVAVRVLEMLLPSTWRNPHEIEKSVHRRAETL
jgi:hypothetical protein